MTESELLRAAEQLLTTGSDCLVVDDSGVVQACADSLSVSVGEPLNALVPRWRPEVCDVLRSADGRWIRLQHVASAGGFTLLLVLDRTCEVVREEATLQSARRDARTLLAGATAREMNDAMTIVQGRLELLRAFALGDPEAGERHCGIALEHSGRLSSTLHTLRMVGVTTGSDLEAVRVLDAVDEAMKWAGIAPERSTIDVHPASLSVCAGLSATRSVLAGVLRSLGGASSAEFLSVEARAHGDRVRIQVERSGRRREIDAVPLGIVATLLSAMGGQMSRDTAGAVIVDLPSAMDSVDVDLSGRLLVVGRPSYVDRIQGLIDGTGLQVESENSGESALERLEAEPMAGVLTELLLPGICGLSLCETVQDRGLPLGAILMTPEPIGRMPSTVRVLHVPWSRNRLLAMLANPSDSGRRSQDRS